MVRGLPIYDGASISDRCGRNSLVSVESEVTGAAGSVELGETPCIKDVKRDAAAEPAVGRGLQTPPPSPTTTTATTLAPMVTPPSFPWKFCGGKRGR
jgi:hypothetical protein